MSAPREQSADAAVMDRTFYPAAPRSLRTRLARAFVQATPARRRLFSAAKRVWLRGQLAARRRLARGLAARAAVALDPERGFAVLPPGHFDQLEEVIRAANALIADFDPETNWDLASQHVDRYAAGLIRPDEVALGDPWLRFALRDDVISSAACYLGIVPILANVKVWYSRFDGKVDRGRQYHCDMEDVSMFRMFVYCHDVDESNGALVAIRAKTTKAIERKLRYKCAGNLRTIPDATILATVGAAEPTVLAGPAGTTVVIDTARCFHYGSRIAEGKRRTAVVFTYMAPHALVLPLGFRSPLRHLATPELPELQRLVLGGDPEPR